LAEIRTNAAFDHGFRGYTDVLSPRFPQSVSSVKSVVISSTQVMFGTHSSTSALPSGEAGCLSFANE
ncbi:MAG TPA: hypothetical protein VK961_17975, partial [Chthoniobacter sp.]|nr:hypothetical protein [Chthoniobacter sp.]